MHFDSLASTVSSPLGREVTFAMGTADSFGLVDKPAALRADDGDRTHSSFPLREPLPQNAPRI
jgi:hypothetical protein